MCASVLQLDALFFIFFFFTGNKSVYGDFMDLAKLFEFHLYSGKSKGIIKEAIFIRTIFHDVCFNS